MARYCTHCGTQLGAATMAQAGGRTSAFEGLLARFFGDEYHIALGKSEEGDGFDVFLIDKETRGARRPAGQILARMVPQLKRAARAAARFRDVRLAAKPEIAIIRFLGAVRSPTRLFGIKIGTAQDGAFPGFRQAVRRSVELGKSLRKRG